ncbi:MAG: hypothetical protein DRI56_00015 [Chloroflexota bacterium]|nr:MAG: hypothetical protein B6243_00630 [Anaerolineaceae bacterium 4572_5.2]RLD11882.1 MAG: hypothetical protein DRI56_00015 [Chloroflexota bacterium]
MLKGKGFFIWKIAKCEGGNVVKIAEQAAAANFSHVLIKIADGTNTYNYDWDHHVDLVPPLARELRKRGIEVWGWHFVYGNEPKAEAQKAIQRIHDLDLEGYVIDAEGSYAQGGKEQAAKTFMNRLISSVHGTPIALSSYRYPSYHPNLPWDEFLSKCDYNMPQVYWMKANNPGEQLRRSIREFKGMKYCPPIIPTGAAFTEWGWTPTASEVLAFLQTAKSLNLSAANFWEWENCRLKLPAKVWRTVRDFPWKAGPPPPLDIAEAYIQALNTGASEKVVAHYAPSAVHITPGRTVQGVAAIQGWYDTLFNKVLPNATFKLTGYSGVGNSRHITWTAESTKGSVKNGNDTVGLSNGKIAYHFSYFTVK